MRMLSSVSALVRSGRKCTGHDFDSSELIEDRSKVLEKGGLQYPYASMRLVCSRIACMAVDKGRATSIQKRAQQREENVISPQCL